MGIKKTGLAALPPATRDSLYAALRDPRRFRSTEANILPWLLLAFVGALAGGIGSLLTVSWDMVEKSRRHGDSWAYILDNNPELLGIVGGTLVATGCVWFGLYIHKRCGHLLLPGAVAKILGGRIVMMEVAEVSDVEVRTFTYGSSKSGSERMGTTLKAKLTDGSTFSLISDSAGWIEKVRQHIVHGGPA